MDKKVNIALVGVGYWGPNLLRNFFQLDSVSVLAVCDLKQENLDKMKKFYPAVNFTKNYEDLINNPEIEAIVIATPVHSHFALASKALENNKHVLLEKPMTSTAQEAQRLIDLAKAKNKILMVDHTFLYTGAIKKIKEMIVNNELGDLYYFSSQRINLGLIQEDVNVAWDLAVHDLSIMDYLIGEVPDRVSAIGTAHLGKNKEEMMHIMLRFNHRFSVYIFVSWLSPLKIRQMMIGGSKKMILYDDIEPVEKVKIYDKSVTLNYDTNNMFWPLYREGDTYIPKLDQKEALKTECEHFIDCIINNKQPLTDGAAGLKIVKILEAINLSLEKNGAEVNI
ncbi:MAG: oxidoreductase [Parcubacteria group bacterium]|nr:MAG: oxidoreductase [Parcubacteria group bacterium]